MMTVFHFWFLIFSRLCLLSLTTQDSNETARPSSAALATSTVTTNVTTLQERSTESGSFFNWLVVLLFIISLVFFITSMVLLLEKFKIWPFTGRTINENNSDFENKRMAEYQNYISNLGNETKINTVLKKDAPTQTTSVTVSTTPASSEAPKESQSSSATPSTKSTEVTATTSTLQSSPASNSTPQTSTTAIAGQPLLKIIITGEQAGQTQNFKSVTKKIESNNDDDKLVKVGKSASKVFQYPESVERFYSISDAKAKKENREKSEVI